MPSDQYIKKYAHKKLTRSSEEIQMPILKPEKHIIPVDLIVKRAVKPYTIYDHTVLDERSEIVWKFITTGR